MIGYAIAIALLPLAGTVAALGRAGARRCGWAAIAGAVGSLVLTILLGVRIVKHGPGSALDGFVYVDGLSAFFLVTVAIVTVLASIGSASYLRAEEARAALSSFQIS